MKLLILRFIFIFTSCIPLTFSNKLSKLDYIPPIFEELTVDDEKTISLYFNEKCFVKEKTLFISDATIDNYTADENGKICISLKEKCSPGKLHKLNISVSDTSGNTISLISEFYGYNPNLPTIFINEFRTNATTSRPPNVELYCATDGNLAGMTIFTGTKNSYKNFFIFPSVNVKKGDYIVVHFKPDGDPSEKQELVSKSASGGREALSTAFDFWVDGGSGISKTNGAISLYTTKNGRLIDCVIYSSRNSLSDTKYRGFGTTATLTMVKDIEKEDGWQFEDEHIKPEDCINPSKSTSTKTHCRKNFKDTNSKNDWYICGEKECSIGSANR